MHMTPSLTERFRRWRQPDAPCPDWHSANRVSIYHEEAERICRFVMAYPNLETGGDLFGFWTNSGAPVVAYAIGPGRYSRHCYASFYQDAEWLHAAGTGLYDRHGLQHIGEWHSHHQLGLNQPSAGDIRTVVHGMEAKNWRKFVLMIATLDASPGSPVMQNYYLVNPYGGYKPLRPRALPGGSPFRTGLNDAREEPFDTPAGSRLEPSSTHAGDTRARQAATHDDRPAPAAVPTHAPTAGPKVRPERKREQQAVCPAKQNNEDAAKAGQRAPAVTGPAHPAPEARRNLADRPNTSPVPHHGDSGGEEPPDNEGAHHDQPT